jgi:uncharacterized Zn-finger protein
MSGGTSGNSFSCSECGIVCDSTSTANHGPYCCSMCDKRYPTEKGLNYHLKTHTGYSCPNAGCNEIFESSALLQEHKIPCARPYACTMVGCNSRTRRFATQGGLEKHLKKHAGYPCTVLGCTDILTSSDLLREHEKTHGMSKKHKKSFPCDGCDRVFTREDHLKKHRSKCKKSFSTVEVA